MRGCVTMFVSPAEMGRIHAALRGGYECTFKGVAIINNDVLRLSDRHVIKRGLIHDVVLKVEYGGKWDYDGYEWVETGKVRKVRLRHGFMTCDEIIESEELDRMEVVA